MRYWPQKPPLGVPVNWGDPLARGLVGCWLMNEGGGNIVNDLSGNGRYILLPSGATQPQWQASTSGPSLYFDGGDVTGGTGIIGNWNPYEFTVCIKCRVDDLGSDRIILSAYGTDSSDEVIRMYRVGASNAIRALNDYGVSCIGPVLATGTFYDVIFTSSVAQGKAILYIDGKVVATDSSGIVATIVPNNCVLGRYGWTASAYWLGMIDHLSFYNRVLSASEVLQLYMTPFRMFQESF
jgi:hypothetical protein